MTTGSFLEVRKSVSKSTGLSLSHLLRDDGHAASNRREISEIPRITGNTAPAHLATCRAHLLSPRFTGHIDNTLSEGMIVLGACLVAPVEELAGRTVLRLVNNQLSSLPESFGELTALLTLSSTATS
jgi:hypothetical protein